jgi:N-acetylmuramoyl-L-alanine amidase
MQAGETMAGRSVFGPMPVPRRLLAALAVLCLALLSLAPAAFAAEGAAPLRAYGYRMVGDATRVRLILQFDGEPSPHWFQLRAPHRLVVDLPGTRMAIDPAATAPRGLVKAVHYGKMDDGNSRLVIASDGPFVVEALDVVANESSPGYRLVADIAAASEADFEAALAEQVATTGSTQSTPKGDRVVRSGAAETIKPFTVVIDAGHGGIDSGAEGVSGTLEKTITLAFALELKKKLEESGRFAVHLTRDHDVFLRLDERVRVARQYGADLFLSIHADTIRYPSIRGATVYTVSDQASDAESAAVAARENLSDELAGMSIEDANHEVSDILMDLVRRETHTFSMRFAHTLVGELSSDVDLIKNPHRYAGFRVLKAPDVPSVLLELGYLSNEQDEKHLKDAEWRAKAIANIASAIELFAGARVGSGN